MSNLDTIAADFLAVVQADRREKTKRALEVLLPAYDAGTIFNVDFKDMKGVVDRSFEEAWRALVQTDYTTYWMPDKTTVSPRGEIANAFGYVSGVRNAIALTKQAAKLKIDDPHLDTVKKFLAAVLPLALVLEKLKTMVVKGKKPLSPEKQAIKTAQLAKKNIKTCGCCFRPIAVLPSGLIADHGYTIPRPGMKGGSCPGRQFRPLEVSDDGLKHMVKLYEGWIAETEKALVNAPKKTEIMKPGFSKKVEIVKKGDPTWDNVYKHYVADLESSLRRDEDALKSYQTKLRNWKPAPMPESIETLVGDLRALVFL